MIKLTTLGAGTFFANINQTASSYLLEIDNKKILVDCGPGTLVRLSQVGVKPDDLDFVFITHFHTDHTSDLFPLFMNYSLENTFAPKESRKFPKFYGPEGIGEYMLGLSKLSELLSVEGWEKIPFINVKSEQSFGKFIVKAFKVKHEAFNFAARAYAYRFECGNKVITFSGDSAKCGGIEKACNNADIFVCDCSFPKNMVGNVHMNTEEIGIISQQNNVKKLVLTHFYPFFDQKVMVTQIKENFSGEIIVSKDLMEIL